MTEYRRIADKAWHDFGKSLLTPETPKGSEKQQEFLRACLAGKDAFLRHVSAVYTGDDVVGERDVGFKYKFSMLEFVHAPRDTERIIWNAFKGVPVDDVSSCGFWGHVVITLIDNDMIEPKFLAAGSNGDIGAGGHVIEKALQSEDEKMIDDCVRRILRSLCNPAPRGKRVIFNDFYLGKAFWRWCWSERMSVTINLQRDEILKILRKKYYAVFSEKMHSGKCYISAKNILGGLLLYLKDAAESNMHSDELGKLIDHISHLSAWKAIEMQSPGLNKREMQAISKILWGD